MVFKILGAYQLRELWISCFWDPCCIFQLCSESRPLLAEKFLAYWKELSLFSNNSPLKHAVAYAFAWGLSRSCCNPKRTNKVMNSIIISQEIVPLIKQKGYSLNFWTDTMCPFNSLNRESTKITWKSLNNNDRDQVLWARETEHPNQTIWCYTTYLPLFSLKPLDANLIEVMLSEVFQITYTLTISNPLRDILIFHFLNTIKITLLPHSSYFSYDFLSRWIRSMECTFGRICSLWKQTQEKWKIVIPGSCVLTFCHKWHRLLISLPLEMLKLFSTLFSSRRLIVA